MFILPNTCFILFCVFVNQIKKICGDLKSERNNTKINKEIILVGLCGAEFVFDLVNDLTRPEIMLRDF